MTLEVFWGFLSVCQGEYSSQPPEAAGGGEAPRGGAPPEAEGGEAPRDGAPPEAEGGESPGGGAPPEAEGGEVPRDEVPGAKPRVGSHLPPFFIHRAPSLIELHSYELLIDRAPYT